MRSIHPIILCIKLALMEALIFVSISAMDGQTRYKGSHQVKSKSDKLSWWLLTIFGAALSVFKRNKQIFRKLELIFSWWLSLENLSHDLLAVLLHYLSLELKEDVSIRHTKLLCWYLQLVSCHEVGLINFNFIFLRADRLGKWIHSLSFLTL